MDQLKLEEVIILVPVRVWVADTQTGEIGRAEQPGLEELKQAYLKGRVCASKEEAMDLLQYLADKDY